jgi:hypothetical protein
LLFFGIVRPAGQWFAGACRSATIRLLPQSQFNVSTGQRCVAAAWIDRLPNAYRQIAGLGALVRCDRHSGTIASQHCCPEVTVTVIETLGRQCRIITKA